MHKQGLDDLLADFHTANGTTAAAVKPARKAAKAADSASKERSPSETDSRTPPLTAGTLMLSRAGPTTGWPAAAMHASQNTQVPHFLGGLGRGAGGPTYGQGHWPGLAPAPPPAPQSWMSSAGVGGAPWRPGGASWYQGLSPGAQEQARYEQLAGQLRRGGPPSAPMRGACGPAGWNGAAPAFPFGAAAAAPWAAPMMGGPPAAAPFGAMAAGGDVVTALGLGAFLGLVAYGTYDLTNMATLKDWPRDFAIVDIIWGPFVSGVSAAAGTVILKLF